jgi:coenzyme F420-reducing hydrogenase gamma subunit
MPANQPGLPTLAVWKFSSCDGCQLTLLNCEAELLAIAGSVRIANFPEASREVIPGPYDISLVEGSIATPEDERRIKRVREQSRCLVTIGACATAGGVQALRNAAEHDPAPLVYPSPQYLDTLRTSTPIAAHVQVDYELRGCPVNKGQLLEVIAAVTTGRRPAVRHHSVCLDCKRAGRTCVLVARGIACEGPYTQAGCGALCPAVGRGCYGCFGPVPGWEFIPFGQRQPARPVPAREQAPS